MTNCQIAKKLPCSMERSFSMLRKLLAKDRHFSPDNAWKLFSIACKKSLAYITVV